MIGDNNEVINDISEPNCKGDIFTIQIECHPMFVQSTRIIENINCKNFMFNMKCHGEGDDLYPP